ncbi:MAG: FliH/SctL family protein [Alphaproteobacteria bacterium]
MKYPRYLFDVDFDAIPKKPARPSEAELQAKAAPTFSEEDLKRECSKAREEGRQEGLAQSNAGFEHRIAETLTSIDARFSTLDAAQRKTNERIAQSAISLAAAIAGRIAPEYARENGLAEIEAFVTQCMSNLFGDIEIAIRVPDALAEALGERLPPVAKRHGLDNGIRIIADPDMPPADCQVDWTDGGAERNGARLLASIDAIVEKFLEHSRELGADATDELQPADSAETPASSSVAAEETPAAAAQATPRISATSAAVSPEPPLPAESTERPAGDDRTSPDQVATAPETEVAPAAAPAEPVGETPETVHHETASDIRAQEPATAAGHDAPPALPGAVGHAPTSATAEGPALPGAIAPGAPARK